MSVGNLLPSHLRADCSKCCSLCCVGPAFDTDQGFGFNKPAHTPCTNLRPDFRCAIHSVLESRGFPSCVTFDCYGAGQRVTQQLFGGRSWRSLPELAPSMFSAYSRYRVLHELMALVEVAIVRAPLSEVPRLRETRQLIEALCESEATALDAALPLDRLRMDVLNRVRQALGAGLSGIGSDDTLTL